MSKLLLRQNRYVIIGSAPTVCEHWGANKDYYLRNGFALVALNNAWAVVKDTRNFEWCFPADFPGSGFVKPGRSEWSWIRQRPMSLFLDTSGKIRGYKRNVSGSSGTMSINMMHVLFNRHEQADELTVVVMGSDFLYSKDKPSFYGKGSADPLRFGEAWLVDELAHVAERYESKPGFSIYADSPGETKLPFPQFNREELDISEKFADLRDVSTDIDPTPRYLRVIVQGDSSKNHLVAALCTVLPGGILEVCKPLPEANRQTLVTKGMVLAEEIEDSLLYSFRHDLFANA